jgi:pyruvate ferredoxin oxidoreductase beta subunit
MRGVIVAAPLRLKELAVQESTFAAGHRLCRGCPEGVLLHLTTAALGDRPAVIINATSCLEVSTTVYPYTTWKTSWYHNAFENAAAGASGVEAALNALKRRGKIDKDFAIIAVGGDGGTYDIGFQALSGMAERGHKVLYICYDNEAYMNTGIQRSGATPLGAWTTTSYAGPAQQGKREGWRKDMVAIMAAHGAPYVAQSTMGHWRDYMTKVQKALAADGPAFIAALSPCWRGWRFKSAETIEIAKLAVETNFWPLFEIENGKWQFTAAQREGDRIRPIEEFLKPQGRFAHFFRPGGEELVQTWQQQVNQHYAMIKARVEVSKEIAIY